MSCAWPCPVCNEVAFWSYASPHACGARQEDEGNAMPLTIIADEPEDPPVVTGGRS